ncbi:MAG: DUF3309 domain-containing protein [Steroidobacteraceae bacterium]
MDMVLLLIILLLLFGGGGGLYWGLGAGWGIGPIGLIVLVVVVAFLLYGRRKRL